MDFFLFSPTNFYWAIKLATIVMIWANISYENWSDLDSAYHIMRYLK